MYIAATMAVGTTGVKVFKRLECGANLKEVAVNTIIPTRTAFVHLVELTPSPELEYDPLDPRIHPIRRKWSDALAFV